MKARNFIVLFALVLVVAGGQDAAVGQQEPATPPVMDAAAGLLDQFDAYPLVAIAEFHGLRQLGDLYVDLIHQPKFIEEVGNVVMEIGNANYQAVIDRYVNGEDIPFDQLQKVWTPTYASGFEPVSQMYIDVYRAVREVNADLPPDQRVHVWLGDPPLDADHVTQADLDFPFGRDTHYAGLLTDQILAQGKKALVIIGAYHLDPAGFPFLIGTALPFPPALLRNVRQIMDEAAPGKLYVASVYQGMPDSSCAAAFDAAAAGHSLPALIPLRGTPLADLMNRPECRDYPTQLAELPAEYRPGWADAVIDLAPIDRLTMSMYSPDEPEVSYRDYLDSLGSDALQVNPASAGDGQP